MQAEGTICLLKSPIFLPEPKSASQILISDLEVEYASKILQSDSQSQHLLPRP